MGGQEVSQLEISFLDIPEEKDLSDYPEGTKFFIDDRPAKYDPETFERVLPDDPRYDKLPVFDYLTGN